MFGLRRKKASSDARSSIELSLVELCGDGYCAVVGESHYQEALRATSLICTVGPDGRSIFTAALVPELDNPYNSNAIAVYSPEGKIGHFSRDSALDYGRLFADVIRLGYHGGACVAHLTGGTVDKPAFGVVLRLADAESCLEELRGEDFESDAVDAIQELSDSGSGLVRGRHYTSYVEEVKDLRRAGREAEAQTLLLELVGATEAADAAERWGVAPWYYEQLAISHRKTGDVRGEIEILERFARQRHPGGVMPPKLLERLGKARAREQPE